MNTSLRTPPKHQLNMSVDDRVHANLVALAKEAGMPPSVYAKQLFEAAYAARHAPTGDEALDRSVASVLLLHRQGVPPEMVSEVVCMSKAAVERTIKAWRAELAGGAA